MSEAPIMLLSICPPGNLQQGVKICNLKKRTFFSVPLNISKLCMLNTAQWKLSTQYNARVTFDSTVAVHRWNCTALVGQGKVPQIMDLRQMCWFRSVAEWRRLSSTRAPEAGSTFNLIFDFPPLCFLKCLLNAKAHSNCSQRNWKNVAAINWIGDCLRHFSMQHKYDWQFAPSGSDTASHCYHC